MNNNNNMNILPVLLLYKEAILMNGCYVEVVFKFVAKAKHHPSLVPMLFLVFDIPTYSFIF